MPSLVGEKLCAINVEPIGSAQIIVGLLWVDRWHLPTVTIPGLGEAVLPKEAIGTKRSRLFLDIKLRLITNG